MTVRHGMVLALAVSVLAVAPSRRAAADELTKITLVQTHPVIGVGEEVPIYFVPKHLGYFREEGLDVAVEGAPGPGPAVQVLESGSTEFATTMAEIILQTREQGGDPRAFYGFKRVIAEMAVLPDSPIKTIDDFKGKVIGGLSWGGGGPLLLSHILADKGFGPGDYTRVGSGTGAAAAAALADHKLDVLVLWDAMFAAMENSGMRFRYIDLPLQRNMAGFVAATTDKYMNAHPKVVEGLCRAMDKGLYFTRHNPEAAIRIFYGEYPGARPANVDAATGIKYGVHILDSWLDAAFSDVPLDAATGSLVPATWDYTETFYRGTGMLNGSKPAADGYTDRFIDACHAYDRAAVAEAAKSYAATAQ